MEFIDSIIDKAKSNKKTIILPEANDIRVLKAASTIQKEKIANKQKRRRREKREFKKWNEINVSIKSCNKQG